MARQIGLIITTKKDLLGTDTRFFEDYRTARSFFEEDCESISRRYGIPEFADFGDYAYYKWDNICIEYFTFIVD